MHAGSQIVRSILSGTTTTRRPTATVQPLRDLQARPAVVQPAPTDPRLITLLEKALEPKPAHEDPRVAELMARVAALEQAVQDASRRLAEAAKQAQTMEARLLAMQNKKPQEPPTIVVQPAEPASQDHGDMEITPERDGAGLVRRYTIRRIAA